MKNKKKLLLLGGLRYLVPVIKAAHDQGYYVITCDYLPENPAHRYSDEFHNVSIIDKEAVLELAKKLKINGILSFAVDPGVTTAAYVAEELDLPFNGSYKSVEILQNKALFRDFLAAHNFKVPKAAGFKASEFHTDKLNDFSWPLIIKPVDSAGSKGVSKVNSVDELEGAIEYALKFSPAKEFIIEEFIVQNGFSSDSDSFSIDGDLKVCTFADQRFDKNAPNPYTPSAYSWPATMNIEHQKQLHSELQRLIELLDLKTGIYNIETRVDVKGNAYIMEVSPRGGGNRLSEMIRYAGKTDLITNAVRTAVGDSPIELEQPKYDGFWSIVILYSTQAGIFKELTVDESVKNNVVETDLWVSPGDKINAFTGANETIGTMVLRFDDRKTMEDILEKYEHFISVNLH